MAKHGAIYFLNRFYRPDMSATSQILGDLAEALAADGRRVVVIASRQLYEDPSARLDRGETINSVEIRHVWTSRFGRVFVPGRLVDYLTFYAALLNDRGETPLIGGELSSAVVPRCERASANARQAIGLNEFAATLRWVGAVDLLCAHGRADEQHRHNDKNCLEKPRHAGAPINPARLIN